MKKLIALFLLLTFLLPVSLKADDVSNAEYKSTIIGTNSGDASSLVCGALSLNATAWVNAGILNSQLDNLSIRDSSENPVAFMPGENTTILFAGDFQATSSKIFNIYTGNVSGGDICYFPDTAGMSVNDTASMEWGSGGQLILDDWYIDTTAGSDKNIFYHYDSTLGGILLLIDPSETGKVIGRLAVPSSESANLTPNAAGYATGWPTQYPASGDHYDKVDDPPETPDTGTTLTTFSAATETIDYYNLTTHTLIGSSQTDIVTKVYFRGETVDSYGGYGAVKPLLRLASTNEVGTYQNLPNNTWTTYSQTIAKPGGGNWSQSDIDSLQVGVYGKGGGTEYGRITQVYVNLTYTAMIFYDVELTGISTGKHDITVTLTGGNFTLDIDGTSNSTACGSPTPDSTEDWIFAENDTVKYLKGITLKVGGVTKGQWEYDITPEFEDLSGNGNTGYPSFLTYSSDPDVSFVLNNFSAISTASADYNPDLDWPSMISTTPTQPDTMYTENSTPGIFFAPLIHAIWPQSGVPESFFWYNFTFIIILAAGILSFKMHPSLLLKVIVGMAIMIFWALPGINVYGMFVVLYKGLYCFGILVLSKHYGW